MNDDVPPKAYVILVTCRGYIVRAHAALSCLKACRRANDIEKQMGAPMDGWSIKIYQFKRQSHSHLFKRKVPA